MASALSLAASLAAAAGDPPVLLIPTPELPVLDASGSSPRITFALRPLHGETVAEGYTTRRRLVEACGPAQPWVSLTVDGTIRLLAAAGATVLVVDPGSPGGAIGVDVVGAARSLAASPPAGEPGEPVSVVGAGVGADPRLAGGGATR